MNHLAIAGFITALAVLLLCAGCVEEKPEAPPLEGTNWVMTEYSGVEGSLTPAMEGTDVTAYFGEDGSLGGSGGCNSYHSSYETDGYTLSIGVPITTLMYCGEPEGLMEQESAFFTALGTAVRYDIQDGNLKLFNEAGAAVLVFSPMPKSGPEDLQERIWQLTSYNNGNGGMVSVLQGTEITAVFGNDLAISGNAGCNHYGGSYELNESEISIGPLFMTEMYCAEPDGVMAQESAYLAAIEGAATWDIQSGSLTLSDEAGTRLCVYSMGPLTERSYLTEREWRLSRYLDRNGTFVSATAPDTETTAYFDKNGTVSGNAGCNQYHATYETTGTTLTIGPLASTRMMCIEAVMEQESAYLLNLGNAAKFGVSGDTLSIMDDSGSIVLELVMP
jgi:heat shock protein HslJ